MGLDPENASYQHYRGVALKRLGRLEEAAAAFRQAAQLDPGQPGPPFYLGWVMLEQGKAAESEKFLREAIRLDPTLAEAHFRLALALITRKDFAAAVASLRKAIELLPNFDLAWYNLGKCYTWMGKKEEARKAFDRFRELEPYANRIRELQQTLARSPADLAVQKELRELLQKVGETSHEPGRR